MTGMRVVAPIAQHGSTQFAATRMFSATSRLAAVGTRISIRSARNQVARGEITHGLFTS
jgi:hypothetical protein